MFLDPPCATNGLRFVSKAILISSSGRLIPSATGTSTTFSHQNDQFLHGHLLQQLFQLRSISCSVKWF